MFCPVTYVFSSLASHTTSFAISSGSPNRRAGTCAANAVRSVSFNTARVSSVFTNPGDAVGENAVG